MIIKAKAWNGQDLTGTWVVTRKIDGVRVLSDGVRITSRRDKPLHNLNHLAALFTDAEVWLGSWDRTISAVRSHEGAPVPRSALYVLDPPDRRLVLGQTTNPTAKRILAMLRGDKRRGCDGLVLRQGRQWLKVKHVETYDVPVHGLTEGRGKHEGRLGAAITPKGNVGAGFTDLQRHQYWKGRRLMGCTIEVSCRGLTKNGKFIEPRFERLRDDK